MKSAERRVCHPGADRCCLRFVELPLGGNVKADFHACSVYGPAAAYVRNGVEPAGSMNTCHLLFVFVSIPLP